MTTKDVLEELESIYSDKLEKYMPLIKNMTHDELTETEIESYAFNRFLVKGGLSKYAIKQKSSVSDIMEKLMVYDIKIGDKDELLKIIDYDTINEIEKNQPTVAKKIKLFYEM